MENTGIAAAGEAGIGGEAGIIGTDRDSGAGGGRDGECGVGSGREEAGLWTDGISAGKPEVKGTGDQAAGGETQGPDAVFDGQMVSCALKGQVNFLRLAVGGWHAIKQEKFCRTKSQTRRAEDGDVKIVRQRDQMLYDRDINEGDRVWFDERQELVK